MTYHKPMIEKQLGWSMLLALVGLVWWGGTTMTQMQSATTALTAALDETRGLISNERNAAAQIEVRVRALETQAGRTDEKLANILSALTRIERQLEQSP